MEPSSPPRQWVRPTLQTALYAGFFLLAINLFGWAFLFAGGTLAGSVAALLVSAVLANQLCLRIFEGVNISEIGLPLNGAGLRNLSLGLGGGALCAGLALLVPVLTGGAHFVAAKPGPANTGTVFFIFITLLFGALGEELLFRGYAFQLLLRAAGPWQVILPAGVLFSLLHADNPHSTWLGQVNTAGFGIAFGYAFLRTHDIWLPLGLHYGWNLALLLLGSNISGLTMRVTGYELAWTSGELWSGGGYGPEASVVTSAILVLLLIGLSRIRVHRQTVYLLDRKKKE